MAGVIGRSGRKSWDKEAESKVLWQLAVPILKRALRSHSKVSPDRKIEIALELVKKMLPAQHQVEAHGELYVTYPPDWHALDALVGVRMGSDRATVSPPPHANGDSAVGG